MEAETIVNLVLCILSFVLATVSVVTVVLTLKQNNKMIETANRPYVVLSGETANFQSPSFYLVLKNYGKSGAIIEELTFEKDLSAYTYNSGIKPFGYIKKASLAPNQNIVCSLDGRKISEDKVDFINGTIKYRFGQKIYDETFSINIRSIFKNLTTKASTKGKELEIISYTLQEMVQKQL